MFLYLLRNKWIFFYDFSTHLHKSGLFSKLNQVWNCLFWSHIWCLINESLILYSLCCLLFLIGELLLHLVKCYHLLLSHIDLTLEKSIVCINLWKPVSILLRLILTKNYNLLSSIDADRYLLSNISLLLLLSQSWFLLIILLFLLYYDLLSLIVWVLLIRGC